MTQGENDEWGKNELILKDDIIACCNVHQL